MAPSKSIIAIVDDTADLYYKLPKQFQADIAVDAQRVFGVNVEPANGAETLRRYCWGQLIVKHAQGNPVSRRRLERELKTLNQSIALTLDVIGMAKEQGRLMAPHIGFTELDKRLIEKAIERVLDEDKTREGLLALLKRRQDVRLRHRIEDLRKTKKSA